MEDNNFFETREDIDGVRVTWNSLPRTKLQHERNIIPMATMFTPLNNKSEEPIPRTSQIVNCRQCQSFINPFVDRTHEVWMCKYCGFSNRLVLDETGNLPVGLQATTVEYGTNKFNNLPPIFIYVIDTCFEVEDIEDAYQSLKESLVVSLSLLPENALVGLVSYGKNVQIHSVAPHNNKPVAYSFNGAKEYNLEEFRKSLGILDASLKANKSGDLFGHVGKQFLQPITMVEYEVTNIIENLLTNTFPRSAKIERPYRATGCAINIASLLLTSLLGNYGTNGGHVLCFTGGVCTYGPGQIVGNQLREPLRSHHDIETSKQTTLAKNIKLPQTTNYTVNYSLVLKAKEFYKTITQHLIKLGISCSYFVGSYDQVGLWEMDEVCRKTGGVIIMSDSFNTSIFKQSFMKFFKKNPETNLLESALNATLEIKVENDLQIQGLIGNAIGLPHKPSNDRFVSKTTSKGEGKTNSWKLCHINPQSTFAIYFDKLDSPYSKPVTLIQYITHYQHASGEYIIRVTTLPINIVNDTDIARLELDFDQEAAVVAIARNVVNRLEVEDVKPLDLIKEVDKLTIDFCSQFARYTKGVVTSFMLSNKFAFLPHFIFHLRRSPFISVFNNSPDETSFVRHILMHEDTNNCLIMIQPTLLSYNIDKFGAEDENGVPHNEPEPVLLDSVSLIKNGILLLDTFFHILIYHGQQVAEWRKLGYHEMEGYEHFKEFLEAPKKEALEILMDRFPLPRFIDCDEGGSQARFLMAKLNPSSSYSSNPNIFYGGQTDVLTDDLSMQLFMDHIQRVVTAK